MRHTKRFGMVVVVLALLALPLQAQERLPVESERMPGASIAAAFANVVFLPLRLAVTIVGAELGGFTGLMTAGNEKAARDVWNMFRGDQMLTPEIMAGQEPLRFGASEFRTE